jgi:rhodanese-related sulfurtransferase
MFSGPTLRPVAAFLAILISTTACGPGQDERPGGGTDAPQVGSTEAASFEYVTVAQLRGMMSEEDPFLVNVHIPFEGDIPDTDASIRFDEIADHLDELPPDRNANIVLYCRSGRMSEEAATTLASLGFSNVSHLEGGFVAWEAAGYPLER